MPGQNTTQIIIYEDADQSVDVRLDGTRETVWLTQRQMAEVFDTSTDNISHLKNVFKDGELDAEATTEESSVVRQEGQREVTRRVQQYNLDAILSVGYRVHSKRAAQFRQWATRVLRKHLLHGCKLSRQRFETNARELDAAMSLLRKTAQSPALDTTSGRGLADTATRYAQAFLLLQRYDEDLLEGSAGQLPTLADARDALAA